MVRRVGVALVAVLVGLLGVPVSAPAASTTVVSGWVSTATSGAVGYTIKDAVSVMTGAGFVARSVSVQRRASTSSTWATVATGTTASTGAYTAAYSVPATGVWYFRLSVTATSTAASATTPERKVTGITGLTTAVSGWATTATGGAVGYLVQDAVSVQTGAAYVARAVSVQRRASTSSTWSTVATGTTTSAGAYTAAYSVPAVGVWYFRLVVPATATAAARVTSSRSVTGVTGAATEVSGWVTTPLDTGVGSTVSNPVSIKTGTTYVARTVSVQRRPSTSSTWTTVNTGTSSSAGAYTAAYAVPTAGVWFFRLSLPPTATAAAATTAARQLTGVPAPTVTAISPAGGPTAGGTVVTVTGTNLTAASEVKFGSKPGTALSVTSATQLQVTTPATTTAGSVSVTVTTAGGTSATTPAGTFDYADTTPPAPVAALQVTSTSTSSVALSWANPGDADLTSLLVRRATGSTPPTLTTGVQVAYLAAPATTFVNVGLQAGSTYTYAVFARDAVGNTSAPATVTVTTQSAPPRWWVVSPGESHLCGLRTDGSAWCSGSNQSGQLGHGGADVHSPDFVRVAGDGPWASIDAGAGHTCGVKFDGTAWCWGSNSLGELGNGTTSLVAQPVPLQVGTSTDWFSVSAGRGYTCGLKNDGTAWCWGGAGGHASLGMLGDGSGEPKLVPTQVAGAGGWAEVWSGWFHTCARKADGTAWCWGDNSRGQTGSGDTEVQLVPVAVPGASWQTLTVGAHHTCGLQTDGSAWCWGANDERQIGDATQADRYAPAEVAAAHPWISLAAGYDHTCGVAGDGTLWCWGSNSHGQLGAGNVPWNSVPAQVGDLTTWVSVVAGERSSLALREDASAWRWGASFWATEPAPIHDPERF